MYVKICKHCGKKFIANSSLRLYCSKACKIEAAKERKLREEQLCWTCQNTSGNKCSWFSKAELPVEGWVAESTIIMNNDEVVHSYKIKECPNYKK